MPTKTKLTIPTQDAILAASAARRYGHVLPLPEGADAASAKTAKLLKSMLAAGRIEEHPTSSAKNAWRSDEQSKHSLLRITEAARQAIPTSPTTEGAMAEPEVVAPCFPTQAERPSAPAGKLGQVLAAVRTGQGASLDDLVALTGWQRHTVRASLTRLRHGGVPIELTHSDGWKRYSAAAAVPPPNSAMRPASGRRGATDTVVLTHRVGALDSMDLAALRREWVRVVKTSPHLRLSADLLRLGIAHRLQEQAFGRCSPSTLRRLAAAAHTNPSGQEASAVPKAGTTLVREWHGRSHTVRVLEDGFEYGGRAYASLTRIVREITGVAWSGPSFFGFVKAAAAERQPNGDDLA